MANNTIDIKEDAAPTKKLASQSFTRGVDTVHQEEVVIGDGTTDGRVATVTAVNALKVDNSAVVQPINDNGAAVTVDALDLDIRNLATGQDKVDVRLRNAADAAFIEPATDRTTAGGPFAIRQSDGSTFIEVRGGDVAHDAVDSGNPVKIGGKASGVLPTAVAAADRTDAYFDREGRQIVRPWGAGTWTQVNLPAVNTRATSTRSAGAAGVRHVCTGLTVILAGDSTAPAATVLDVRLRDGIADTGTILWQAKITLPAVAGAMNGVSRSGLHIPGTAATAMTLEFSAAGGANTFESVSFEGVDITEA